MYQHWLTNFNKCATLMEDVNNGNFRRWGDMMGYVGSLCTFHFIFLQTQSRSKKNEFYWVFLGGRGLVNKKGRPQPLPLWRLAGDETNTKQGNKDMKSWCSAQWKKETNEANVWAWADGVVREGLSEVTLKRTAEGTTRQNGGRELHVEWRACAKTLRKKGNLGTHRSPSWQRAESGFDFPFDPSALSLI